MSTTSRTFVVPDPLYANPAAISTAAAKVSFVAAAFCLLLILLLHILKNDLAPAAHMLSEYAIGPYGWVMQAAFFAWAVSCFSLTMVIRSQVVTTSGRFGMFLLLVAGAALVMGGVFVIDPPYAPPAEPSLHGSLHGMAAMIGLPGQAIAALLISYSLRRHPAWAPYGRQVILLAHFTWISLLLMFAATFAMMALSKGQFSGITGIGWFNRLAVLQYCGWLMVTARVAVRVKNTSSI